MERESVGRGRETGGEAVERQRQTLTPSPKMEKKYFSPVRLRPVAHP